MERPCTDSTTVVGPPAVPPLQLVERRARGRLVLLVGPHEGRAYDVGDSTMIGRAEEADISIPDPAVSRAHVCIRRMPTGGFEVEDQGSRNGTLLDGRPLRRERLEHGSRLQLGPRCLLLFSVLDPSEVALLQAQQIELMAQMSAGFSHDFNNVLCTITANAAHLRELPGGMSLAHLDVRECLDDLHAAANQGAELTRRLEPFALSASVPGRALNLSSLCASTLRSLRRTLPRSIELRERVQSGLLVHAREGAIRDLLLHPCLNARDAMPDGGTLTCELFSSPADELPVEPILRGDAYAVLRIRDTGGGLSETARKRAFEPFFTTKEVAIGSGLGLTIVRKIAHDLGGGCLLESEPGGATTLSIVLPVTTESGTSSDTLPASDVAPTGEASGLRRATIDEHPMASGDSPLILVVDDNESVRRAVVRALKRSGYRTCEAADGLQAVALFEPHPELFAAAILDIDMPRMDGRGCLRELRKRRPGMPIMLLSGLVDPSDEAAEGEAAPDLVMKKPIEPLRLLEGVAKVVAKGQGAGNR